MLRRKRISIIALNPQKLLTAKKQRIPTTPSGETVIGYKVPMTVLHTSQVVDPPDGQVPPLTALAKQRESRTESKLGRSPNGPEDPPTTNRCVRSLTSGPPIIGQGPGSQETTLEIVQGPGAVVVRESMDSQIIPLDGRPRPPESVHLDKVALRAGIGKAIRSSLNRRISLRIGPPASSATSGDHRKAAPHRTLEAPR